MEFLLTLGAETIDFNVVTGDEIAGLIRRFLVELALNLWKVGSEDIRDFSTVFTNNVVVWSAVKVIAQATVIVRQFNDDAQIHQEIQCIVDSSHAEIGQLAGERVKDGVDRRVVVVGHQISQNNLPLRGDPDVVILQGLQGLF